MFRIRLVKAPAYSPAPRLSFETFRDFPRCDRLRFVERVFQFSRSPNRDARVSFNVHEEPPTRRRAYRREKKRSVLERIASRVRSDAAIDLPKARDRAKITRGCPRSGYRWCRVLFSTGPIFLSFFAKRRSFEKHARRYARPVLKTNDSAR